MLTFCYRAASRYTFFQGYFFSQCYFSSTHPIVTEQLVERVRSLYTWDKGRCAIHSIFPRNKKLNINKANSIPATSNHYAL